MSSLQIFQTPKYLRSISDWHIDRDARVFKAMKRATVAEHEMLWTPPAMPDDEATVLLIPGDIWYENHAFTRRFGLDTSWLEQLASRFQAIVLVLGNHDYWGGSLQRAVPKARETIAKNGIKNVFVLEQSSIIFGDLKILGGTLWTDYNRGNPMIMMANRNFMNDYDQIFIGSDASRRPSRPEDMYAVFTKTQRYIFSNAKRDHPGQKVVVVTHMAPSFKSIHEKFHTMTDYENNFAYFSDLDDKMHEPSFEADLWFHGHNHLPFDYMVDRTRVICNPRGYTGYENTGFDPLLRVNIEDMSVLSSNA